MPISNARLRRLTGALLALALIVFGAPWTTTRVVLAQNQVLFVSVVDADGEPVTDLTAEEVTVQWDGMDCETLDLEPINWPVRITIFVDNAEGGSRAVPQMRNGLRSFVDAIPDDVEISIMTLASRPTVITAHTTDRAELADGIDLIAPLTGSGATLLDALVEEAQRLDEDDEGQYFPVIVMVASDGVDTSGSQQQRYQQALQRLVDNLATVHTLMLSRGNQGGIASQVGANVAEVTRGSHETLAMGQAFETMLPELAEKIARKHRRVSNQYRLTYAQPDGASAEPGISVATTRQGLNLIPTIDGNVP